MPEQFRVHDRVVTYLDSAPWPQGIAQHVAPAGAPDAGRPAGTRDVVVLVHAFPLNADMWESQLEAAAPGWRYLAPDLRGFGRSDPEDDVQAEPSMNDYARDVLALLDNLRIDRAIVAGL
jgi:pimeloyl-ACP methyl ester carboxylesterase